jgi:ATPases involved in chromosome partitioning
MNNSKTVQVISANITKGGVGKTTIIYNGAYFLTMLKGKKVLLADFDFQMNLTNRFIPVNQRTNKIKPENDVLNFFGSDSIPEPLQVDNNLWLIPGNPKLEELLDDVKNGKQRNYLLQWYYSNLEKLSEQYDYILFDTHNDHNMITDNILAVSDKVIAIADVDGDSMSMLVDEVNHINKLKKLIVNPVTGESFVNTKVVKIGNKIIADAAKNPNTSNSNVDHREFVKALNQMMEVDDSFLGYFWERGPLAKAKTENKSMFHLKSDVRYNKKNNLDFYLKSEALFDKIFQ